MGAERKAEHGPPLGLCLIGGKNIADERFLSGFTLGFCGLVPLGVGLVPVVKYSALSLEQTEY